MQADQVVLLVEPGRELAHRDRPEEVVGLVLLARPDRLHRNAREFLGHRHRLADVVLGAAAPAEAAAEIVAIDLALRERQARFRRQCRERGFQVLRRRPAFRLVGRDAHGGVHHLHAGMREERRRIGRLDLLRRAGDRRQRVAVAPVAIGLGRGEAGLEMLGDGGARHLGVVALVPDDRQRVERGLRLPPGVGDDRDRGVLHPHDLADAGHLGDLGLVDALDLAAVDRGVLDRGVEHARQLDVDRVDLAAVELGRGIEPLHRLAGDRPVLRVLELDALGIRRRELRRRRGDPPVGGLAPGRGVPDGAVRRRSAPRPAPSIRWPPPAAASCAQPRRRGGHSPANRGCRGCRRSTCRPRRACGRGSDPGSDLRSRPGASRIRAPRRRAGRVR